MNGENEKDNGECLCIYIYILSCSSLKHLPVYPECGVDASLRANPQRQQQQKPKSVSEFSIDFGFDDSDRRFSINLGQLDPTRFYCAIESRRVILSIPNSPLFSTMGPVPLTPPAVQRRSQPTPEIIAR